MKYLRCKHKGQIHPHDCIRSFAGNFEENIDIKSLNEINNSDNLYFAIQYYPFRQELRKLPKVPLIYFYDNILILEKPSKASIEYIKKLQMQRQGYNINNVNNNRNISVNVKDISNEINNIITSSSLTIDNEKNTSKDIKMYPDLHRKKPSKKPNPLSLKKKQLKPLPEPIRIGLEKKKIKEKIY